MGTVGGSYSWNAICDVCGFQFKGHELKKRWDGLVVCSADYETRHPLDFFKVRSDYHKLPFVRPERGVPSMTDYDAADTSTVWVCTEARRRPYVGSGTVGCATLGIYP
jgi:hypothetical protein